MARLYAVAAPLPGAKPHLRALAAGADARGPARRLRAGGDGSRRDDLHPARPGLRHLPLARALPRPRGRHRRRPAAPGARGRRSRCAAAPPTSRSAPTARCCSSAAPGAGCSAACSACPAPTGPRPMPAAAPPFPADWRAARRGAPHLHPLPPGAAGRSRPGATRGAGRLPPLVAGLGGGAAEPHAQGAAGRPRGARARQVRLIAPALLRLLGCLYQPHCFSPVRARPRHSRWSRRRSRAQLPTRRMP